MSEKNPLDGYKKVPQERVKETSVEEISKMSVNSVFKKWWFYAIVLLVVFFVVKSQSNDTKSTVTSSHSSVTKTSADEVDTTDESTDSEDTDETDDTADLVSDDDTVTAELSEWASTAQEGMNGMALIKYDPTHKAIAITPKGDLATEALSIATGDATYNDDWNSFLQGVDKVSVKLAQTYGDEYEVDVVNPANSKLVFYTVNNGSPTYDVRDDQ